MNKVILSLGSNLGERFKNLEIALNLIGQNIGEIETRSSIYKTEPWGIREQPEYLNMVVMVNTPLTAIQILSQINNIEKKLQRVRHFKWGSRTIDIDILFYNDEIINTKELIVPHPEIRNRRFVLIPLLEIIPEFIHPVLNCPLRELIKNCPDLLKVEVFRNDLIKC